MNTPPPGWLNRTLVRRQVATVAAAVALLVAGLVLFVVAGSAVWLKVFSGFLMGTGATRLVLALRQSARATGDTRR